MFAAGSTRQYASFSASRSKAETQTLRPRQQEVCKATDIPSATICNISQAIFKMTFTHLSNCNDTRLVQPGAMSGCKGNTCIFEDGSTHEDPVKHRRTRRLLFRTRHIILLKSMKLKENPATYFFRVREEEKDNNWMAMGAPFTVLLKTVPRDIPIIPEIRFRLPVAALSHHINLQTTGSRHILTSSWNGNALSQNHPELSSLGMALVVTKLLEASGTWLCPFH